MEQILCCHCYDFFTPSPRHKNQRYCMEPQCRRAKKAAWKRHKMATDPDFKLDQKLSNKKWAQNNPGYWKKYRKGNPEKAERNRILQVIRNRRRFKNGARIKSRYSIDCKGRRVNIQQFQNGWTILANSGDCKGRRDKS